MNKIKFSDCSIPVRILLLIFILGFVVGFSTHLVDLIRCGFLPYNYAPLWKNIYWTSLTFLDLFTVFLLLRYILPGIILSNLIIISDVIVNTNGFSFFDNYMIIMQIVFGLYVLITSPIILVHIIKFNKRIH